LPLKNHKFQCPRQPGWAPCIPKETANQRFASCCSRLGEGCIPLCNYDAPLSTMQLAVLTGRCPLNKMADIMVCASGYEDATACCEAYNVFEPGYEQCRPYCNPAAGLPQGGLLSEKYKCLAKLSSIQQCFYVSQKP
ncbi:DB module, partial [Oesophagostomum dentatum]